jgi:prepilin-type N-terminal cleavage/methylation domain-containing protein
MPYHRRRHTPAGFTLIELLVIIAIIAILAAILFPVFAQAREKARQAACLSNQKQIGLAVLQYVQDYDETFPLGYGQVGVGGYAFWENTWYLYVTPYVKSVEAFRCPDDPLTYDDASFGWAGPRLSYAANGYWVYDPAGTGVDGMYLKGVIGDAEDWVAKRTTGLADVSRPADTVMVAEKLHLFKDAGTTPGNALYWERGCLFTGVDWGGSWHNMLLPDGTRPAATDPFDATGRNGAVTAAHQKKANFLFCNGHVKSMDPAATNPDPVGRPKDNLWDATRK